MSDWLSAARVGLGSHSSKYFLLLFPYGVTKGLESILATFRWETGYTLEMSEAHQAGQPLGPKYSYLYYFVKTMVTHTYTYSPIRNYRNHLILNLHIVHESATWFTLIIRCAPLLLQNYGWGWGCFNLSADGGMLTPHPKRKDLWTHSYHTESSQLVSCPSPWSRQKEEWQYFNTPTLWIKLRWVQDVCVSVLQMLYWKNSFMK